MPPRESTPGEGGQARALHFSYTPTEHGKPWHAFIAGPCRWYSCHCKGKTKGCTWSITDGAVVCKLCSELNRPEPTGFLPLWREVDWKPVMVIVHENVRDVVARFKHRERVLIGREAGQTDGVWVSPPIKGKGWMQSTDPQKMTEQDVWPTLVRVWKIPELTAWHERETGRSTGGCITPPAKPAILPPVVAARIDRDESGDFRATNDAFASVIRQAASKNGKHIAPPTGEPPGEGV